ncbi:MAG: dTDP-4-amino-4,6-dideoxygalactose transaminase [Candidatus Latescibacteria bacterium]|nr:dTDP-4-amino-4,6-dideoxygalactose transaminase [Candidatus Latescibacterota bacterium]
MKNNENEFKIPFNKPFIIGNELENISKAVKENLHLSGNGPYTRSCQSWLEKQLNCRKALLTHSCTGALEMAAILADLKPGDEVIMPSFTFVSTANAFVLRGAVPVFVDIRPDTLNIDETLIESAITPKTRVIVPVHYAGMGCEMCVIQSVADRYNLFVIEDAAQGLLSTYKGKYLGAMGHLGCLSFHETKNIICGEGGALLINDESMIERAEIIWEKGTNRSLYFRGDIDKYSWVDLGSSFLPGEINAAFLWAQLEHANEIIRKRCLLFDYYASLLKPLMEKGQIRLSIINEDCTSNGHIFYIITRNFEERTLLINHLKKYGIQAVFHYIPLHSAKAGKKFGRSHGLLHVTKSISERLLRLPIYYEMTEQDVEKVAERIKQFYS